MFESIARELGDLQRARRDERGFTLIELLIVVVIVGVLAAIAVPAYMGQQDQAKDAAAKAQLRSAATAQQLHYAETDGYADSMDALDAYGFRQGDQIVSLKPSTGGYCMEAPGGSNNRFSITEKMGKPGDSPC